MKHTLTTAALLAAALNASAAERALNVETTVKATPREVFRTWTTTEGIKTFFAPGGVIEPKSNGLYEIHMNPFAPPGERGADDMRILGLQEDKMLSFTWNAPPHLPEARKQRTTVIVRFAPAGDSETRVTLHQTGWGDGGEWDKAYDYFSKAWPFVLANLKKRFEAGPVDWTPHLTQLKAAMAKAAADKK
ncbi:MAG: SRPBCC domain-containing protein [Betaproteobacteria bacterium]|nr:SRPBCC domain-containing protein [Betaproteobacteria bacterium]